MRLVGVVLVLGVAACGGRQAGSVSEGADAATAHSDGENGPPGAAQDASSAVNNAGSDSGAGGELPWAASDASSQELPWVLPDGALCAAGEIACFIGCSSDPTCYAGPRCPSISGCPAHP